MSPSLDAARIAPFAWSQPSAPPAATEPASGEPWRVESIDRLEEVEALRPEWSELLAASRADTLFLTPEWLLTWWRHIGRPGVAPGHRDVRPALLAVRRGGRIDALAPLALQPSRFRLPRPLGFAGTGRVGSDYLDVVVRAGEEAGALGALADRLDRERRVVEFEHLPRVGSSAALLAGLLAARGWRTVEWPTGLCPFIDLGGRSWERYVQDLGSSHRANLRRRLRKLEERFAVRFERIDSEERLDGALDTFLRLHLARWAERGGSDALGEPALDRFHRSFTRQALERGWLRLYLLRLDGRPAAALYGFLYRGRFLFYQSGFDPEYGEHAVGLVTMGLAIREAIAEGAREYDLLRGDEPYKFLWAGGSRELERLELYPPTLAGQVRGRLRDAARAARDRLRPLAPWLRPLLPAPSPPGDGG